MKYIRTREDALDAAAEILDLPRQTDRLIQSTVRIMMCLDAEPREFLSDCQALLIQGGLEALARRRREALQQAPEDEIIILDPEEDRLLDALGTGIDALRFADVLRQVFPDFRHERWQAARAVLRHEGQIRTLVTDAIRARGNKDLLERARRAVETSLAETRPAWIDRAGSLLTTCRDALRASGVEDPDTLREDGTLLFELTALDDGRTEEILGALQTDPPRAFAQVLRLHDLTQTLRGLKVDEPGSDAGDAPSKGVA